MGVQNRQVRFDAISASHGAASIGFIAFLGTSGGLLLAEKFESTRAIGSALIAIAVVHWVSLSVIGRLARPGGSLAGRFSFRAASHGASAFCIAAIFGCAGVMCLVDSFQENRKAYGFCLLLAAASGLAGFLLFGFLADSRNFDAGGSDD